jgi:hypothetical protein
MRSYRDTSWHFCQNAGRASQIKIEEEAHSQIEYQEAIEISFVVNSFSEGTSMKATKE